MAGRQGRPGADPAPAPEALRLERFTLGPFETNCYALYEAGPEGRPASGAPCWIIDASFEPGALIERVRQLGLKPEKLILTHAHVDHIAGVEDVLRAFPDAELLIHEAERDWLSNPMLNLSALAGLPVVTRPAGRLLREGDELRLGSGPAWRVLHTPGHSPGGVTLYCAAAGLALVGDALFAGSIGRTDFPGCSFEQLAASIKEKLYTLPPETVIWPGHGPESTIGREMRENPYVRG
jgi:hydroxyacylglutathione hydrolase